MKLWCYGVDRGQWGQQLAREAREWGIDAHVFTHPDTDMRKGDYVFMRAPQWEPELNVAKKTAIHLDREGLIMIPDLFTVCSYEDKAMQTIAYNDWFPETHLIHPPCTLNESIVALANVGFPFISKSREASSSVNVRLIETPEQAAQEYNTVMHGEGLNIKIGKGRVGKQTGYLIWQKFCDGNEGDLRVCVNGDYILMLERDNAADSPFASGSGSNRPVNNPTPQQREALKVARDFFITHDLKWNGIDLVFDYDAGEWKILETTLGWSASAYEDCVYFGTDYRGRDVWRLFCEQLKQGVFG